MGGGAIRTAANAAAIASYRSAAPFAFHPTSLKPPNPASAVVSAHVSAAEAGTPTICVSSSENIQREVSPVAAIETTSLDFDDWEFAGWGEEECRFAPVSRQPAPRLVFGPAPTLEEAREATSDLKDALDKVHFTPDINGSAITVHGSVQHDAFSIVPSVPRQVIQAFSLLQGSPEAQDVVASLAADKNVWSAVMNNKKVMEFYKTHPPIGLYPESESESHGDTEAPVVDNCRESFTAEKSNNSRFADYLNTIKVKVGEMVRWMSSFLPEFVGISPGTTNSASTNNTDKTDKTFADFAMGGSFMALAVVVILMVLIKRG